MENGFTSHDDYGNYVALLLYMALQLTLHAVGSTYFTTLRHSGKQGKVTGQACCSDCCRLT